jgi:hypothetical protein
MEVPTIKILAVVSVGIPFEPMCASSVFSRKLEVQASRECVHVEAREVSAFLLLLDLWSICLANPELLFPRSNCNLPMDAGLYIYLSRYIYLVGKNMVQLINIVERDE